MTSCATALAVNQSPPHDPMSQRFQFSLKTLLIVVSLTAVACGVISWLMPETRLRLLGWALGIVVCLGMLGQLLQIVLFPIAVVVICYKRCRRMLTAKQDKHPPYDD
jgi:hypothetical protein